LINRDDKPDDAIVCISFPKSALSSKSTKYSLNMGEEWFLGDKAKERKFRYFAIEIKEFDENDFEEYDEERDGVLLVNSVKDL
jgi:hypothetical protein